MDLNNCTMSCVHCYSVMWNSVTALDSPLLHCFIPLPFSHLAILIFMIVSVVLSFLECQRI
jgi:hypothetical protein